MRHHIWFVLSGTIICFFNRTMTKHTSKLCHGYLIKKESDGVLHQMTWPPQSPALNQIEMVWNELDNRVNEKQRTSAQHMWKLLQDCWKSILHEAGWENAKSVKSCHQSEGWLLCKNLKYILTCLTLFWFLHDSMCYFIVLRSSLLFYNVENSKK